MRGLDINSKPRGIFKRKQNLLYIDLETFQITVNAAQYKRFLEFYMQASPVIWFDDLPTAYANGSLAEKEKQFLSYIGDFYYVKNPTK